MKTEKDLKPIIDCDLLRYRCGFAADSAMTKQAKEAYPDATPGEIQEILAETDYQGHALQNVKTVVEYILEEFNPEYTAFIQGDGNFRDTLATIKPYKGNRGANKPKYYMEIKDYLIDRWNAIPVHGQEADDAMGILQMDNTDKYSVIVSTDKDMLMIPGWHFNWVKKELHYQNIVDANRFFFWQMLVGDTTDNIPGIDQIGVKRATALLDGQPIDECRRIVQELYQRQYGDFWQQAYYEVGNLLWIRRKPLEECPLL